MNILFDSNELTALVQRMQEFSPRGLDRNDHAQLENYIYQVKSYLADFANLQYALDVSVIVGITNVKGDIIYANEKFCKISKYSREELIGQNHRILKSGYHHDSFFKEMWATIGRGEIWEGEVKNKAKDGSFYWVKTTIVPIKGENGKPVMYISFRTNITEGKVAQERLVTALENEFSIVVNSMYNLIFKVKKVNNQNFIYSLSEGKLASKIGLEKEKMVEKSPQEVFPIELAAMLEMKYEKAFYGEPVSYTYSYNNRTLLSYLSPVFDGEKVTEVIGCINDITDLHNAQKEIEFMAYHDALTNLPNKRKFNEDMEALIGYSAKKNLKFAVLFLDLDRFKQLNDSYGHTIGDLLIQEVAKRLKKSISQKALIYRFTGDEFIIILPGKDDEAEIQLCSERIVALFDEMFILSDSLSTYTSASIGISIFPNHGKDYDTLLKNADTAMFVAKSNGRNMVQIYEPEMNQHHEEVLLMDNYLRQAIQNNEFELYYQPKLDLKTGKVTSMETLLRWKNPHLGEVPPDKFIPIAEETGQIIKIDEWVLENACRQNKEWNDAHPSSPLRVAVNISPLHFRLPNFVALVQSVLEKTGLEPIFLEIEITESSFIDNVDECIRALEKLRAMGVHVAIDDFGIGYSSLNYLRKFPVTSLKIDRAFIQEISEKTDDIAIVKAMIYLSHELNLKVVAEGTETKEVIELLKELGCDEIQGYYISRPLPKNDFVELVAKINGNVNHILS